MGRKLRCKRCTDVIESKYRHDFVRCKCGAIFIDGGNDYTRMGGDLENIEILPEAPACTHPRFIACEAGPGLCPNCGYRD